MAQNRTGIELCLPFQTMVLKDRHPESFRNHTPSSSATEGLPEEPLMVVLRKQKQKEFSNQGERGHHASEENCVPQVSFHSFGLDGLDNT